MQLASVARSWLTRTPRPQRQRRKGTNSAPLLADDSCDDESAESRAPRELAEAESVVALPRYCSSYLDERATPNAQAQRSAAWMPHSEGTLSLRAHPSLLSEAAAAGALQLVVRHQED